ncbi:MAG: response regulator [Leptospiraceae bacterium]|nr:response regulator [Leptospiraceae bacterium]
MKLLIVDDSLIMRQAIERFLAPLGLEVVGKADNGKRAIELFRETMPDVVTLDITMPELDGLGVLKEILKIKPDVRVLVVTAITEKSTALEALKLGAKRFLNKPFNEESLKSALEQVLK